MLGNNVGTSREFSDIDVQKLTMTSSLQLYAVLLLLGLQHLRYGFLNSEALYKLMSENVVLHRANFLMLQHAIKSSPQVKILHCCLTFYGLCVAVTDLPTDSVNGGSFFVGPLFGRRC